MKKHWFCYSGFVIAIIFFCISAGLRLADIQKSRGYHLAYGTVVDVTTISKQIGNALRYDPLVLEEYDIIYSVDGQEYHMSIDEDIKSCSLGEKTPVMYRITDPTQTYAAYRDWLSGKYLPIVNWYDLLLYGSLVFIMLGIGMYDHKIDSKKFYISGLAFSTVSFVFGYLCSLRISGYQKQTFTLIMILGILMAIRFILELLVEHSRNKDL